MNDKVQQLCERACDHIDEFLCELGIEYKRSGRTIVSRCPIHGGNNPTSLNLYSDNDEVRGFWVCQTHHCEKKFGANLSGFVCGVLSSQQGRKVTWKESVDWLCRFLGYKSINDLPTPSAESIEKRQSTSVSRRLSLLPKAAEGRWTRAQVQNLLKIPADYFICRGFCPEILRKYDVGYYKPHNRAVVPMYDNEHNKAIGFMGRSLYDKCPMCKMYHDVTKMCPQTNNEILNCIKWKCSSGFDKKNCLYNLWFAKQYIQQTHVVILTEGVGDCWNLVSNGVHNVVSILGTSLSDQQALLLTQYSVLSVILLLDNDDAGQIATRKITEQLKRQMRIYCPKFIGKDVGDLITDDIKPLIHQVRNITNQQVGVV